ncbi:angiopoietin-4-like [Cavia porcellus]|uniref:angiopoietin-4-like n=1 Tax=Cavia porcellus TaxID=10141 RepID=UPI002FDF9891
MQYQIKNGLCSYTFWVPELPSCNPSSLEASNNTQNNQPLLVQMRLLFDHQMEKMENALRNNMQRMEKLEENIQTILGSKLQQVQQNIVQNHMATMLELGTNLLNETTAQNCKLTNMEAQASNQTSHMERQMMETLQTTDRLQKQMQEQRETLNQLHSRKSNLETRLHTMETEWETQLEGLRNERENVRQQLGQQNSSLTGIQQGLEALRNNSNLLQLQQQQLMQSLQLLKRMLEQGAVSSFVQ